MKGNFILIILGILISLSMVGRANATEVPVSDNHEFIVTIDGNLVDFSILGKPMLKNGRTFLPQRFMSKYLGYNGYNEESKSDIWMNDTKTRVEMNLNKPTALVNGKERYIDYSADGKPVLESKSYIYKDTVYVPLRFICETFGEKVDYKKVADVHHIKITTKTNSQDLYDKYYGQEEAKPLAGYILIKDNNIYFNEVEVVEWQDQKRVKELGLNEKQMPNGYIIINKNKEIEVFQLAHDAKFIFTDVNHLFVKETDGNLRYTTSNIEEFLKHRSMNNLGDIPLSGQRIPYFIETEDGKIKSITEEFKYTI